MKLKDGDKVWIAGTVQTVGDDVYVSIVETKVGDRVLIHVWDESMIRKARKHKQPTPKGAKKK